MNAKREETVAQEKYKKMTDDLRAVIEAKEEMKKKVKLQKNEIGEINEKHQEKIGRLQAVKVHSREKGEEIMQLKKKLAECETEIDELNNKIQEQEKTIDEYTKRKETVYKIMTDDLRAAIEAKEKMNEKVQLRLYVT